jgi:hypothetical protein
MCLQLVQGGSPAAFPIIAIPQADDTENLVSVKMAVGTLADIDPAVSPNHDL